MFSIAQFGRRRKKRRPSACRAAPSCREILLFLSELALHASHRLVDVLLPVQLDALAAVAVIFAVGGAGAGVLVGTGGTRHGPYSLSEKILQV